MWKKIGVVGVDSGQLLISDPCYIDSEWEKEEDFNPDKPKYNFSYNSCCKASIDDKNNQLNYKKGHAGVGVCFSTGLGDGCYDVFAKFETLKDWGERITEIKIKFI